MMKMNALTRLLSFAITVLLMFHMASARADLYDDYINSSSKKYFATIHARPSAGATGFPGHAYFSVGVEIDNGVTIYLRIYGLYPNDTADGYKPIKSVFTNVSGSIKNLIDDVSWTKSLRREIDQQSFDSIVAYYDKWKSSAPEYNLLANGGKNCNAFAAEFASSLGLNVPDNPGTTLPINFVKKMIELNP